MWSSSGHPSLWHDFLYNDSSGCYSSQNDGKCLTCTQMRARETYRRSHHGPRRRALRRAASHCLSQTLKPCIILIKARELHREGLMASYIQVNLSKGLDALWKSRLCSEQYGVRRFIIVILFLNTTVHVILCNL